MVTSKMFSHRLKFVLYHFSKNQKFIDKRCVLNQNSLLYTRNNCSASCKDTHRRTAVLQGHNREAMPSAGQRGSHPCQAPLTGQMVVENSPAAHPLGP